MSAPNDTPAGRRLDATCPACAGLTPEQIACVANEIELIARVVRDEIPMTGREREDACDSIETAAEFMRAALASARPDDDGGLWMVVRKRETDPYEVWAGDRAQMEQVYAHAQSNWTDTYLVRVASGPDSFDKTAVERGGRARVAASARPPGAEVLREAMSALERGATQVEKVTEYLTKRERVARSVITALLSLAEDLTVSAVRASNALAAPAPAEADIAALTARVTERFGCAGPVPLFAVTATVRDVVAFVADALAAPAPAPAPNFQSSINLDQIDTAPAPAPAGEDADDEDDRWVSLACPECHTRNDFANAAPYELSWCCGRCGEVITAVWPLGGESRAGAPARGAEGAG